MNSDTILSQAIDLKEKMENTGADHARNIHRPEKYIRSLCRTRDRAGATSGWLDQNMDLLDGVAVNTGVIFPKSAEVKFSTHR